MRKFFLFSGLTALTFSAFAQTPEKKSIALIHKLTATWCPPCGGWGWTAANAMISGTVGKALYIGIFPSSSASYQNDEFYTATSAALTQQFAEEDGIPEFGVNGISSPQNFTTGVESDCIATANAFAATVPTASAASILSISGNTVNVSAKAQFWSATSGDYYLAAYIVEDGAIHIQASQGSAPVAHHSVLRTSMSEGSAWGESIANGSIAENQTYTKTFTYTLSTTNRDTLWDKSKFKVYNVIWKKEGSVYKFVNASLAGASSTAIEDVMSNASLNIFPSPVRNALNVTFDAVKSFDATFTVNDITGRKVISTDATLVQGTNRQTINTSSLTPGVYLLNILTPSGNTQKKFVKE